MMNQDLEFGSFRDRNGRVFYKNGSVYRGINREAFEEWQALSQTLFFQKLSQEGKVVRTEQVKNFSNGATQTWDAYLQHEVIPFISYPYEWCFGMLKDAALFHLDLVQAALEEGMILKDSSAFNVQWKGTKPVFIDIPSFVKLQPGEPWVGYRQFCQMFLYPLMLQSYKDFAYHSWFRGNIDGFDPEAVAKLMSARDMLRSGVLTHVYLQSKLQSSMGATKKNVAGDLKAAGFGIELIKANVKGLRKLVTSLEWKRSGSEWSDYMKNLSYTNEDHETKKTFVTEATGTRRWKLAWDIGCNNGTFSHIAAKNSDYTLAMDVDHLTVDLLYQALKAEKNETIHPMVMNVADASPSLGWRGKERKIIEERGKPELVMCLAVIHHIVITANVPMAEYIQWLRDLGCSLIIEFVTKEDPMVVTLLRNRKDQYDEYTLENFERLLGSHFKITKREALKSGTRVMFFAEPR